jgi:predicted site-specific integrase-resolvase
MHLTLVVALARYREHSLDKGAVGRLLEGSRRTIMRVSIYARYSSDLQRAASIEDQVLVCTERVVREKWTLAATYTDRGISGASHLRPGYQKLLEGARKGEFDIVLAEALDRISRDQEHVASFFKLMSFAGIRIVTLTEGEISELHPASPSACKFRQGRQAGADPGKVQSGNPGGDDRHDPIARELFHEQIPQIGFYRIQRKAGSP